MCLQYKSFENTTGKGEIAGNKQFLLFLQCFLSVLITSHHFHQIHNCRLQTLSIWKSLKLVIVVCKLSQFGRVKNLFGKGLMETKQDNVPLGSVYTNHSSECCWSCFQGFILAVFRENQEVLLWLCLHSSHRRCRA